MYENEECQENEITLKFSDLWKVFLKRLWLILLVAVLAVTAVFGVQKSTYKEEYTSSASIYVLVAKDAFGELTASNMQYYYNLSQKIVDDCKILLRSKTILNGVMQDMNLKISYLELLKGIKVETKENSQIITLSVTTNDPELSQKIAQKICDDGVILLKNITGLDAATVFEAPDLPRGVSNPLTPLFSILAGFLAAVVTYVFCCIGFYSDDKIKDEDDVERYLGLIVLSSIPNAKSAHDVKGRYSRYGSKKYSRYSKYEE